MPDGLGGGCGYHHLDAIHVSTLEVHQSIGDDRGATGLLLPLLNLILCLVSHLQGEGGGGRERERDVKITKISCESAANDWYFTNFGLEPQTP